MKIVVERKPFLEALTAASSVCPNVTLKPVLQSVLMTANGAVELRGTDMERFVQIKSEGTIEDRGTCLLPARKVCESLKFSSDAKVQIKSEKGGVRILGERLDCRLQTESADTFPVFTPADSKPLGSATVAASVLKNAIRHAVVSCDLTDSRYALGSILFNLPSLWASDGRRGSIVDTNAVVSKWEAGYALVREKSAVKLAALLPDSEEEVRLEVRGNFLTAEFGGASFAAILSEGRFPRLDDAIPNLPVTASVPVGPFLGTVRQAMVAVTKEAPGVLLDFKDGTLSASVESTEGESACDLPIVLEGKPVKVKLAGQYLCEFLSVLGPEADVSIAVQGADSAVVFTSGSHRHVIMSMN